jgi:hypothetical protein
MQSIKESPTGRGAMNGEYLTGRLRKAVFATGVFVATQITNALAQQPYYDSWSVDRSPVELQLHDNERVVRFSVPRANLHFSEDIKGGPKDGFSMYVVYPSMQPLSGSGKSTADEDVLSIYLNSYWNTGARFTVERFFNFMMQDLTRVDSDDSFDLYIRKNDLPKWSDKSALLTEFLVPKDKQIDRPIYFECFRELGNLRLGCSGFVTFGNSIELRWIFRRDRLKEWPEMFSKVESFVTSLVKN